MVQYITLLHPESLNKAADYLKELQSGSHSGDYLNALLPQSDLYNVSLEKFIELLVQTKKPQIFAESAVAGNGSDWNSQELSILGDISIAAPVSVYDNGLHRNPNVHTEPFSATLLFTPGALLRNGRGETPADWNEVVLNGEIDPVSFFRLYERRLLPPLLYANMMALSRNKKALITIPGLGCGQFAGRFQGQLGEHLQDALKVLLEKHHQQLNCIRAVYFDPFQECDNARFEYGGASLLVRPLSKGNGSKPQLCLPTQYEDPGDDFSNCELFSVVAWDHVSWPGNDFFAGSRATDDGVKAAATNSMAILSGIEGTYDEHLHQYCPPPEYRNWSDVVKENSISLCVQDNILTLPAINE